jgi:hypothetical protein
MFADEPLIYKFKRAIEQLRLYDSFPESDYTKACVTLKTVNKNKEDDYTTYCIFRDNLKYYISWNFSYGCSRSQQTKELKDLDGVFTWFDEFEKVNMDKNVIFEGLDEPQEIYRNDFFRYMFSR